MKRCAIILIAITMLFVLFGCDDKPDTDEFVNEAEITNWQYPGEEVASYGKWKVLEYFYVPDNPSVSVNYAKDLENPEITFDSEKFVSGSLSTAYPIYKTRLYSISDYMALGLTKLQAEKQIGKVVIEVSDEKTDDSCILIGVDSDNMLYVSNTGFIYYLERITE